MEKPKDLTKRKYFDVLDGAISCLIFIVLQYIMYLGIFSLGGIQNKVAYEICSVILQSCFVLAVIITSHFRNVNWIKACTYNKKVNGRIVLLAVGISIVCLIFFNSLTSAFVAMLEKFGYTSPLETGTTAEYNQITNIWQYLLAIITTCIIPPLCEETLFRGAVLNSFRGLNKWIAIFISGFMFMIMHGNPDQTIYQFILGLVLAYIAWETKNIWVCVIIHAINNLVAITISYFYSVISTEVATQTEIVTEAVEYSWGDIITTFIYGLIVAGLGAYVIYLLTKKLKKHSDNLNYIPQEDSIPETIVQEAGSAEAVVLNKQEEVQQKPDKRKLILTILSYIVFAGYFIKEWISYLLLGLGL